MLFIAKYTFYKVISFILSRLGELKKPKYMLKYPNFCIKFSGYWFNSPQTGCRAWCSYSENSQLNL